MVNSDIYEQNMDIFGLSTEAPLLSLTTLESLKIDTNEILDADA